jgi:energy-coupling factor transport system substrate-specific component
MTANDTTHGDTGTPPVTSRRWTTVDIVVAAVLAVASGVVFMGWNGVWSVLNPVLGAGGPGIAIISGLWFFPAVLVALIVRKPGAALFAEMVAAAVEAMLGSHWGMTVLVSGLVQGLGAEFVFAAFRYRRYTLTVAVLAGAAAGVGATINEIVQRHLAQPLWWISTYAVLTVLGGAIIAGLGSWLLAKALGKTGVLDALAGGRRRERV